MRKFNWVIGPRIIEVKRPESFRESPAKPNIERVQALAVVVRLDVLESERLLRKCVASEKSHCDREREESHDWHNGWVQRAATLRVDFRFHRKIASRQYILQPR